MTKTEKAATGANLGFEASDKYGNSNDFAPPVLIPKSASFRDMVALKGKGDTCDRISSQVIQPLIDTNSPARA